MRRLMPVIRTKTANVILTGFLTTMYQKKADAKVSADSSVRMRHYSEGIIYKPQINHARLFY